MPRLSLDDANAVGAAMAYALSTLPQDAPQRADWEQVLRRLQQRLLVALSQHDQVQSRPCNKLTTKAHPARGNRPTTASCAVSACHASPAPR